MVRNDPDNRFQRKLLVDRKESCVIQARLAAVIHGSMEPRGEGRWESATLIVMDFSFEPQKPSRRIKSAKITARFKARDRWRHDPEVHAIAPSGRQLLFDESATLDGNKLAAEYGALWTGLGVNAEVTTATVFGSMQTEDRDKTYPNSVVWNITENPALETGVPSDFRGAIVLKRETDDEFMGLMEIKTDLSGFSFSLKEFLEGEEDDPVLFAPSLDPFGELSHMIDRNRLGDFPSLSRLVFPVTYSPAETYDEGPSQPPALTQRTARQEVEAVLDSATLDLDTGVPAVGTTKTSHVELWNMEKVGDQILQKQENDIASDEQQAQQTLANMNPISGPLDKASLSGYFPWVVQRPASPPEKGPESKAADQTPQHSTKGAGVCALIARSSDKHGFTTYSRVKANLLIEPSTNTILDFFRLPEIYGLFRRHDRGTCQQILLHKLDDKVLCKVYIIQTPFYRRGFWSLILHTIKDAGAPDSSSKTCGILQADKDTVFGSLFHNVCKSAEQGGHHPMLLPTQLFLTHFKMTMKLFQSLLGRIAKVEGEILYQLGRKDHTEEATKVHQSISMTLHQCSMELAELGRRTKFEEELSARLIEDLKGGDEPKMMVAMLSVMSKSRRPDIEELPAKIEGLRNVLYSLITQHDSFLQAVMTQESLRDSKAMKTLAVLTILFLPGAFLASVFSTGMFEFQSKGQEIGIFVAITIPLTVALMVGWILWLRMTRRGGYRTPPEDRVEGLGGREATTVATSPNTPGMIWWKGARGSTG